MPKHRRSDILPAPAPFGAPADVAEYWPEPVGYGHPNAIAGGPARRAGAYATGDGYDDYYDDGGRGADASWAPVPDERSRQDWEDWQREIAPPLMHPDHPSAPVPMVQLPAWEETARDRYEPVPSGRFPGPGSVRFRSGRVPGTDSQWPTQALAGRQAAQVTQQARDQATQILDTAERDAVSITQEATGEAAAIRADAELEAAAIREAASREAAAIREAAEREAAALRATLDSMCGELGRVTAYVAGNLGPSALAIAPPLPATRPGLPGTGPALPGAMPDLPGSGIAPPDSRPGRPRTTPTKVPAGTPARTPARKPLRPGLDGPARQTATPTKKGQAQGRQRRAMRVATAGTAALLSIAAIGAVTYTGIHGFDFFVFREGGQGETPGGFTDAKFLARQAAAQHHDSAPKGRHHKAPGSK